jgi:hypothetical protein
MAKTKLEDEQLKKYIENVMKADYMSQTPTEEEKDEMSTRFKNRVNAVYEFSQSHPTQLTEAAKGTLWGAYNAISGYYNYIQKYDTKEHKFKSQMFGNANTKILKGFNKALELI